jgi:hypothetical protein
VRRPAGTGSPRGGSPGCWPGTGLRSDLGTSGGGAQNHRDPKVGCLSRAVPSTVTIPAGRDSGRRRGQAGPALHQPPKTRGRHCLVMTRQPRPPALPLWVITPGGAPPAARRASRRPLHDDRQGLWRARDHGPEALRALEPRHWRNIDRPNGGGSLVCWDVHSAPSNLIRCQWVAGQDESRGRARFVRESGTRPAGAPLTIILARGKNCRHRWTATRTDQPTRGEGHRNGRPPPAHRSGDGRPASAARPRQRNPPARERAR